MAIPNTSIKNKLENIEIARKRNKCIKGGVKWDSKNDLEVPVGKIKKKLGRESCEFNYFLKMGLTNVLRVSCKSDESLFESETNVIDFEKDASDLSEKVNAVARKQIKHWVEVNMTGNSSKKPKEIYAVPYLGSGLDLIEYRRVDNQIKVNDASAEKYLKNLKEQGHKNDMASKIQSFFRGLL